MERDRELWLDHYAVSCRVFRGRWSIRHCLRIYSDIRDLKIHMSSRSKDKVTHYHSAYNPCEQCMNLKEYRDNLPDGSMGNNVNMDQYCSGLCAL